MAYAQAFFVQAFTLDWKNRLIPGRLIEAKSAEQAVKWAESTAETAVGVMAFSQRLDKEAQDAEEPEILAAFGELPPEAVAA